MKPDIAAEMLIEKGISDRCLNIFNQHWPDGARVLLHTARKAQNVDLSLIWFAKRFLIDDIYMHFHELREEAWAKYVGTYEEEEFGVAANGYYDDIAKALIVCWKMQKEEIKNE